MGMRVRTDHDARQRRLPSLSRWLLVLGLILGLVGSTTAASLAGTAAASPVYVQVARAGTTYTACTSGDGMTWSPLAGSSVVMTMTGTALGGLAVAANSTSALSTAQFDAVTLSTQTATTLGNAQVGGSQDSYDSYNMDGSKVTTGPRGAHRLHDRLRRGHRPHRRQRPVSDGHLRRQQRQPTGVERMLRSEQQRGHHCRARLM